MARKHPNWIKSYLQFTNAMEAPDTFHFWTAVSTIAGALRRRVWFDMGHFQWTPNFYILFVAPPGIVSKSTTLSVGMGMLREIKDVRFGPDSVTCAALVQSLASARLDTPIEGAFYAMSAVTIASSELGTFLNPHDREMVDVLVDLWDNRTGAWEKITKTSGSDKVVNPWVNIAACTTPAWIAGNFPDYMVGGGFTSRCIFVYADTKRRLVAYPFLESPAADLEKVRKSLVSDLQDIALMGGPFTLSPMAIKFGEVWYGEHYAKANPELNNSQFAGYLARKQTHIHKLAMVLSAAESSARVIQEEHLRNASLIITSLEADMPRVFANIGLQNAAKDSREVLAIVKAYGRIRKKDLFRICSTKMGLLEFNAAAESILAAEFVQLMQEGTELIYVYAGEASRAPRKDPNSDGSKGGD